MRLFAYLDPGSASALLAAILAGIAGIGAALKTYGKNFLDKLMFWKKSESGEPATAEAEPPDEADTAPDSAVSEPAEPAATPSAGDRPSEQ